MEFGFRAPIPPIDQGCHFPRRTLGVGAWRRSGIDQVPLGHDEHEDSLPRTNVVDECLQFALADRELA
jgi:hypothetical protein